MRNVDLKKRSGSTVKIKINVFGLCEGRHDIEHVNKYIFEKIENVFDFETMNEIIYEKLKGVSDLHLYVTGLTPALTTVINYCYLNRVNLTLYHFNRDTGEYVSQVMYNDFDLLKEGGY